MSRISLLQTFNQGLRGMLNLQSKLYDTQNQLATGKRVNQPSDDPVAAARILQLDQELAAIDQYNRNLDGAENALMLEESQLDAVTHLLTRVRELATAAGSPALSHTERGAIAAEVASRLDELLGLANTRNTSGEYIFAGHKGEQAPFVRAGDTFNYRGDDGVRMLQLSNSTYVAMGHSGRQLFDAIPMGVVPAAVGTLVPRVTAAAGNVGAATMGNGAVTDADQVATTFAGGASYRLQITNVNAGTPQTYDYDLLDGSGASTGISGTHDPATPLAISFGGADYTLDGMPEADDSFTLTGPAATISNGHISDRAAFASTFTGPASIYQVAITGVDPTTGVLSYEMQDGTGAALVPPVTGSFMPGESVTFGGAEFRIVGAAEGDTFSLSTPASQNMLDTVARLAQGLAELGDSADDGWRLQDLIGETLTNLSLAEENVGVVRAQVGARLNTIDSTREMHAGTELVSNKVMSEVRDLDYAEALTRLTLENTMLQAAQQSFAKISKLSLFDFLR